VFLSGTFNGGVAAEVNVLTAGNVSLSARNLDIGSAVSGQTLQAEASNGLRLRDAAVLTASASSGNTLTLRTGAGGFDNAAGAAVLSVAGSARWLAYAPDPSLFTAGGLVPAFKQYAAPFGTAPAASGNGLLLALAPAISATLQGSVGKVYDTTTAATLVPANFALSGAQASDTVAVTSVTSGAYSSKDVGSGKTVLATGLSAAVTDTATGVPVYGYAFSGTASGAVGSITPATLSVSGLTVPARVYDATTTAILAGTPAVTALAGDTVSVAGVPSGLFGDKNVGSAKPVTLSGLALAGADAGNYLLLQPSGLQGDITPRPLPVAGVSAAAKVYDATLTATLSGTATVQPLPGDVLGVIGTPTALFADKNVGTAKAVTASGYALNGADAANYQALQPTGLSAAIAPAPLGLNGLAAGSKVYDATTTAVLTGTATVVPLAGDSLGVAGTPTALFADKNVGTAKAVSLSGLVLTGADAANYTALLPALVADITMRPLSLAGLMVPARVYDATRVAALAGTPAVAALAGDTVSVAGVASGLFGDKNVGTAKPVTVSGLALAGADAGNYLLLQPSGLQGDITPRPLPVAGVSAAAKVYDATLTATLSGTAAVAPFAGDVLGVAGTPTALFADKHVGTAKPVTASGYALNGADAANYQVLQPSGLVAAIIPATLSLAGLAAPDKIYDGSTTATLTATLAGVRPGDAVSLALGGSFANAGAGTGNSVAYSAGTGGVDASNYSLSGASGSVSASILPATLTYRADTLSQNVGLPIPALTGTMTGFVGAETLASATTGALRFTTAANASTAAGSYAVTGSGLLAANYVFVQAPGNAQALRLTGLFTAYPSLMPPTITLAQTLQTVQVPVAMSAPAVGRVLDVTPGMVNNVASESAPSGLVAGFGAVNFSTMPRADVQSLLAAREQYKKQTLATGITRLEQDPRLADVPECVDEAEITSGSCLVTQALRKKIQARLARLAPEGQAGAQQGSSDHRRIMQAAVPSIARKLAVLIGINRYLDSRIPTLSGSIPDARAIRQLLESRLGYEATIVEDASREAIVRALNRVALEAGTDDSVIVYYAGHGVVVAVGGVDTGFWLPADGNAEDPSTWLSNADIGRLVSAIGSKQLMLVSDSCFSGSLAGSERVQVDRNAAATELLSRRAAVVLSSGGNEPVADEGREGHSFFAWHFMRALESLNDWQVGSSLFERVRDAVVKDFPQTPQYGASRSAGHQGNTDYLFERRELEARATR
jgi:hypothetical protein